MKGRHSDSENETSIKINNPMGPEDEMIVPGNLECFLIWLVLFGLLKGRHLYPFVTFTVTVTVKVEDLGKEERMLPRMLLINSPIVPEHEVIVQGDL